MEYLIFTSSDQNIKPLMINEKYFDLLSQEATLEKRLEEEYAIILEGSNQDIEPYSGVHVSISYNEITFSADNGMITFYRTELHKID